MRLASLFVLFACEAAAEQADGFVSGGSAGNGKVTMSFETRLEPGGSSTSFKGIHGGVVTAGPGAFAHRYLLDPSQHKYFGYDASFEPVPGTKEIRFVMRALSLTPADLQLKDPETWSPLPLPKYPPPQTLHDGDKLQFELMTNPNTGQRIVEHIELRLTNTPVDPAGPTVSPRDFRADDVDFELNGFLFTINGKPVDDAPRSVSMRGSPLWIYMPKRGRYVFSLAPRPDLGFQRAGQIFGSLMEFRVAGEEFRIKANRNIVPGDGTYHLYVHHDPSYRPQGEDHLILGVGGTLESLVRR